MKTLSLPKIINVKNGDLNSTILDLWRDKVSLKDKMDGVYYDTKDGKGVIYNKNNGEVYGTYEFNLKMSTSRIDKYKLVK